MINSIQKEIKLNHVYLNNAIEVNMVDNKQDKTKHLFENVWALQKYLVEETKDKKTAYQLFSEFMEQYHIYMKSAISYRNALNTLAPGRYKWALSECPYPTIKDFGHSVLH